MKRELCEKDHSDDLDTREDEFTNPEAPMQSDEARDEWARQVVADQERTLRELSG